MPAFPLGVWNLIHARQRKPMWDAPNIKTRSWIFNALLGLTTFQMCCHHSLLTELSISSVTTLGEDHWKLMTGFPRLCTLTDLGLSPFTAVNHSCDYDHMLSPAIPSSELLNLGLVSGNLTQRVGILIIHITQRRKLNCRQVNKIPKLSSRLLERIRNYSRGCNGA